MENCGNKTRQCINRYPLLQDSLSLILFNVIEGINNKNPIHMSLGYLSLILDTKTRTTATLHDIKNHLESYIVVGSNSDISGMHLKLKQQSGKDFFEPGEFIYSCRSGYFHFVCDLNGALKEIIADFYGETPSFIPLLVADFPHDNFRPTDVLIRVINTNGPVEDGTFLNGLNPVSPIQVVIG